MLSFRPHQLAFFVLFHCLLLAIVPADAVPVAVKRQDSAATTVMTQTTTTTLAGDMTQTCVITLTPITDDQGNPAVRQVKTCTVTMGGGAGTNNGGTNNGDTNNGGTNSNGNNSGSTTSSDSSASSTSTADTSSASAGGGGGPIANGVSNVPKPSATSTDSAGGSSATNSAGSSAGSTDSASATSSANGSTESGGGSSGGGAVSDNGVSIVAAPSGGNTPTAAEQQAAPSESTAFTVPGQKLQVLPIGLGVFAGISVIALIVVGLVTYERTKYRKAFRARKLAESGAGMGYGGMAQRS